MTKYSLLTSNQHILSEVDKIDKLLYTGVKVIAFCELNQKNSLEAGRGSFIDAKLLQLFLVPSIYPEVTISDGLSTEESKHLLDKLAGIVREFNYEQYLVEHADANANVIVEAGAGTGKTTVMIDRILFLLHTVPGLSLEDIGMITFTNEATQNMKHKIQSVLRQRYKATKSPDYIIHLENSGKLRVQTIHSFSKDIISELGTSIGYSNDIAIRSFKYEKKQLIHDVLNEKYKSSPGKLSQSLGARLHELDSTILNFWNQLENLGLTDEEIFAFDWGSPSDKQSASLHNTLKDLFNELYKKYDELKIKQDSIAVGDIVRELKKIISDGGELVFKSRPIKYLFVDEFQDSDNAQIKTVSWLQRICNLRLFAVGDVKQSIYRFRGAVDTAFDKLRQSLLISGDTRLIEFTLYRNYRSSRDILQPLDLVFKRWERMGLLSYGANLLAQKNHAGIVSIRPVIKKESVYRLETINTIKDALKDCASYTRENNLEDNQTQRVTVLTRTHHQLTQISEWCEQAKIPCYIKKEGSFFASRAVRDLYSLVKAYVFPNSPADLFDYINSSFVNVDFSLHSLAIGHPASEQIQHLESILKKVGWENNLKAFRLRPVISVIRSIIDDAHPVERYVSIRKKELIAAGWEGEELNQQLVIEANQFEINIEKAMQMLHKHFSGEMTSLYNIYTFLSLNISTNIVEDEPDISNSTGCDCLYGMTVHKAKGLEFDTVIIPLTHRAYRRAVGTELLLDERVGPRRVGWSYVSWRPGTWNKVQDQKNNNYYTGCLEKEFEDIDREEARLLYVALTRTKRRLDCFVIGNEVHSWAHLLEV